ncbi:MAG: threonine--tRNA ligase [Actinobacteria bacterium]|nr:threonine--tRNA ligase [Actinomycetota bacterium]
MRTGNKQDRRDNNELIEIKISPDNVKKFHKNVSAIEVLKSFDIANLEEVVAIRINDKLLDLSHIITENAVLEPVTYKDEDGLNILRHTTAHVMANAVYELFPGVKIAIGPTIKNGFYYDFDPQKPFIPEDLEKIEKRMREIVKKDISIIRKQVNKEEAKNIFSGETYKQHLINDIEEDIVSLYEQGDFIDLCRGPHLPSTGKVKIFKLLSIAGAYWRGNERNPMLQRIYGTAFTTREELEEYLQKFREAAKRDHRKLGRELDLYSFHKEGPGFPFFHPKGMIVINSILDFLKEELLKRGYEQVGTPILLDKNLWQMSGHWDHYKELMYFLEKSGREFAVKPMNCPGGVLIYRTKPRSYKDMPLKWAELGIVHRYELSGVLHGLFRVRGFTQDDAHIFCLPSQIEQQLIETIDFVIYIYDKFGFKEYKIELSTRPDDYMGSLDIWERAEAALKDALDHKDVEYTINTGEGAFYGPKIDFHIFDNLGRTWQCATIQLDFAMPEAFDLHYTGEDNAKHRPVMIHRTILGSIERFLGILVEHYEGAFPTWLAPVQVILIPITDEHKNFSLKVMDYLQKTGVRVDLDDRMETVSKKIRDAQVMKIPYMLVIGDKEVSTNCVAVRCRSELDLGPIPVEKFLEEIDLELKNRSTKSKVCHKDD